MIVRRWCGVVVMLVACSSGKGEQAAPTASETVTPTAALPVDASVDANADAAEREAKVVTMSAANRAALIEKLDLSAIETRGVLVNQGTVATGGLTREDIDKVIKARAGLLRACYQKELERVPSLQGKVVVSFAIGADGKVTAAKLAEPATTLDDDVVTSCILRQFQRMVFPAKGAVAKVTYPLIFSKPE
jgi:outer membrane biosynthesis protein TonB